MIERTKRRTVLVADLFCGAGGSSSGARKALAAAGCDMQLVAVNHWRTAIDTHELNHPDAVHFCADIATAKPRECIPGGKLDLLMASPTCTYHSRARGGRPTNDQQRMDPWHVFTWLTEIRTKRILIENVPEFISWGPVSVRTGKPLKSRRGEYFLAWVKALESIGYVVDWRVLNAADYGDATTRERFFLIGACDGKPLRWPTPTHSSDGRASTSEGMFPESLPKWRSAREIIDWSIPGRSIFDRKKPLAPNTLKRIARGLEKFGGPLAEPFLVVLRNNMHSRSIDSPVPTISAGGGHVGIADMTIDPIIDRFTLGQQSGSVARSVDRPLPTISTGGAIALVESELTPTSFIAEYYGNGGAQSTDDPLNTVTTRDRFGLVEPMVLPVTHHGGENRVRSTDDPLPTITGARRGELALAEPFIVPQFGERPTQGPRTHSLDAPLPAITSHGAGALVEPLIDSGADTMPGGRLVRINGVVYRIDIRFRMLKPKELARAMGFSDDETEYEFVGTGEQVVKQIGNAVPVNTASALVGALITG